MLQQTSFGRYRIETLLGSGTFGEVYRAVDTVLDRVVALKLLRPEILLSPDGMARFIREGKTAANLIHPHIAMVYDMGEENGRYYIAMRFIDGPSLMAMIKKQGSLPWKKALTIITQIGSALAFAHARGLIHRDVKSQNILVSPQEGAVLTDFGLVRVMEGEDTMTRSGMIMGTPAYMAPELWEGKRATPATDQYALACVLYEMLVGRSPFAASTPSAVMRKHFEPVALPHAWPKDVPDNLNRVLYKALAKNPQERFASVQEFVNALSTPVKTDKPPIRTRPQKIWWIMLPVLALALTIVAYMAFGPVDNTPLPTNTAAPIVVTTAIQNTEALAPTDMVSRTPLPSTSRATITPSPTATLTEALLSGTPAPFIAYIDIKTVYLRRGPYVSDPTVATLRLGNEVQVLGRNSDSIWFWVRDSDGKQGWLYYEWLRLDFDPTLVPIVTRIPTMVPVIPTPAPTDSGTSDTHSTSPPPDYPSPPTKDSGGE